MPTSRAGRLRGCLIAVFAGIFGAAATGALMVVQDAASAGTPLTASRVGAPSPLLSIDQHRGTVIDRIVAEWGEALAASGSGLDQEQLGSLLMSLRSDQLLAASLAGSLEGLRDVIAHALTNTGSVPPGLTRNK